VNHVLVVANETVAGRGLIDAIKAKAAADGVDLVTVLAPVVEPRAGYVVYEDTRRAAAGRRLDGTLAALRDAGIPAHGLVVESEPDDAVRDAMGMLEPKPTAVILSTHPVEKSGWIRKNVVDRVRSAAGDVPVEHVVVELEEADRPANVLVIANETVIGEALLDRIRERAGTSPASFLIVCPQGDPSQSEHPEAERRLRRALSELRASGIEAHGQIAHPDPYAAAMQAVQDERVDEIIVSTFEEEKSRWLRRNLIERLTNDAKVPVEHVVIPAETVGAEGVPVE
jgi:DNA-binding LacI/PurR family transcriptional regulator